MNRYIIEFGIGMDFHGQNVSKAAAKAAKNAISSSCLCGLSEVLGMEELSQVKVKVTIAVPRPEEVDHQQVADCFPIGSAAGFRRGECGQSHHIRICGKR